MSKCTLKSLLAPLCGAMFGILSTAHAEVTVVSWGGLHTVSQQKAYGETWEGGVANFITYNGGLDEIRSQHQSGNVTWDVVVVLPHEARVGCEEGLFEPLDRGLFIPGPDGGSMDEDIMVSVPNDCVVPQILWSYMAFYQEGTFEGEQPYSIADFFDVEKFPGKRGIHAWPNALIEMSLVADGVPPSEVYNVMSTDEGIDRAFAKLDTIKDHAIFWSAGAKPLELVKSGEASMALAYNGLVGTAILAGGERFVPIWAGQVLEEEWLVLMRGAPNRDEAIDFLVHASAPYQNALQAKYMSYGPMRSSALEIIANDEPWFDTGVNIMGHLPNREEVLPFSVFADPDWWAENGGAVSERYAAWMGQ